MTRALGQVRDLPFDAEELYVASLLHDIGLGATFTGNRPFEIESADAAA